MVTSLHSFVVLSLYLWAHITSNQKTPIQHILPWNRKNIPNNIRIPSADLWRSFNKVAIEDKRVEVEIEFYDPLRNFKKLRRLSKINKQRMLKKTSSLDETVGFKLLNKSDGAVITKSIKNLGFGRRK